MERFYDARSTRRLAAALHRDLGSICAAAGKLDEAERQYRISLDMQQRLLPLGMTPEDHAFKEEQFDRMEGRLDPDATCDYADTQCRLGNVLKRINKTDEAEHMMDNAKSACVVLTIMFPHVARYDRVRAFAMRELVMLGSETCPERATQPLEDAVQSRTRFYQRGPHERANCEGLAKALCELSWALSHDLPQLLRNGPRSVQLARQAIDLAPKRADCWTTLAGACVCTSQPQEATDAAERAVELRGEPAARDLLIMAMAHKQLGHHGKAIALWKSAVEAMGSSVEHTPHSEQLQRLHDEAAALLEMEQ